MKIVYLLLLILSCGVSFAQTEVRSRGVVRGQITDARTHDGIPYAQVIVNGTTIGDVADSLGYYSIERAPTGYQTLNISCVGYKEQTSRSFQITSAIESVENIELEMDITQTGEVVVTGRSLRHTETQPLGNRSLNIQQIEKSPGGNRDISKVVQNLPGVVATPISRNDLIVRGGGPNENKFYLDRIEIPIINHFTTQGASGGNTSVINSDFLRGVRLYTSTFPAGYGAGLSSVLDLRMIEGNSDRLKAKASIGASDLALTLDSPTGKKGNIIVSVRRSYLQVLFSILGLPFLPTYNDVQVKYSHHFDERNHLYIIGLGALDKNRLNTSMHDLTPDRQAILDYLPENDQWSYVLGAVYAHYTKRGTLNVIASTNRLNNSLQKWQDNIPEKGKSIDYRSNESEIKMRVEYDTDLGKGFTLNTGVGIQQAYYDNHTFRKLFFAGEAVDNIYTTDLNLTRYAAFGSVNKQFFNNKVNVNLGIRLDGNNYSEHMTNPLEQFSPRFGASYNFAPKWKLSIGAGRYYQEPAYTSMGFRDNDGVLVNAQRLRYIKSDQLTSGIAFEPNNNSKISVEGFYKNYSKYPISLIDSTAIGSKGYDVFAVGAEPVTSNGTGRAYGFEVEYRNDNLMGFRLTTTYTYYYSQFRKWDKGTLSPSGAWIPSNWDNRHLFTLVAMRSMPRGWDVGLRWRFAGGSPYTPYDINLSGRTDSWDATHQPVLDYSLQNSRRLPAFHQMDLRVDKTWFFQKWTLAMYIDIQNLYNYKALGQETLLPQRDDTGKYVVDPDRPGYYKMVSYPNQIGGTIIPTFGIIIEI